jgi:hypothetical protein
VHDAASVYAVVLEDPVEEGFDDADRLCDLPFIHILIILVLPAPDASKGDVSRNPAQAAQAPAGSGGLGGELMA